MEGVCFCVLRKVDPLHRVTTVNVATSTRGRTRLPTELIKGDTRTNNPFCHLLRGTRHPQLLRNSSISSSSRSMWMKLRRQTWAWTKRTVVSGSVSKPLPPNPGRLICPGNYSPTTLRRRGVRMCSHCSQIAYAIHFLFCSFGVVNRPVPPAGSAHLGEDAPKEDEPNTCPAGQGIGVPSRSCRC